MKTFLRLFLFGTILLFGLSCSNNKTIIPDEIMVIDLAKAVNDGGTVLASKLVSDVEMIILDGKKKFYFPEHIIQSKHYKNYSLFYEYGESKLGVFSRLGDLVLTLNKQGQGPGEYAVIVDCGMNQEESRIYIAEGYNKKIHWYDLNGNWLETIDIPSKFNSVFVLPDGNFLFQNQRHEPDGLDSSRLFLCTPKGELIRSIWDKSKEISDFPQFMDRNCIKQAGKHGLLYRDSPMYDTVYQINEKFELRPFFVMDPGKLRLPEDLASDTRRSDEWGKYLRPHYFYFTTNDLLISASNNNKWIHYHVDLKSQEVSGIAELTNDLVGWRSMPYSETLDGKYLVQEIYVPYYKDHIDDAIIHDDVKFPEVQKQLRETIMNASDEMDMILVYYKLK